MSAPTLQKVDLDLSTVLLDLNSLQTTPSAGIGLLDPIDLGVPETVGEFIHQAPFPDTRQPAVDRGVAVVTFKLRVKAATRAAWVSLVQSLGQALNSPGTYRFRADSSEDYVYFDAFSAIVQPAFHGQDYSQTFVVTKLDDILTVQLSRLPYLYEGLIDSSVNLLTNAMFVRDATGNGTPDDWTLLNGTLTPEPDDFGVQISHGSAQDIFYQEQPVAAGTVVTGSIEGWRESGTRAVTLSLVSRPSGTELATAVLSGTAWGAARATVSGTIAPGDNTARLKITYVGGSGTTVSHVRYPQLEVGSTPHDFRAGTEVVGQDPATGGRVFAAYISGNAPTRGRFIMTPDAGGEVVQVVLGKRVVGNLTAFAQAHYVGADDFTLGSDTTLVGSDTSASEDEKVRVSFATYESMEKRITAVFDSTEDTALRGSFIVMGRVKVDDHATYRLRMQWSPGDTPVPAFTSEGVTLKPDGNTGWLPIELGRVTLDQRGTQLKVEVWASSPARPDTGQGNGYLEINYLYLVPTGPVGGLTADEHVILSSRGWRDDIGSQKRKWKGSELIRPDWAQFSGGTQDGDIVQFIQNSSLRQTPPEEGFVLAQGRYIVSALVALEHIPGDNGGRGNDHDVAKIQLVDPATGTEILKKTISVNDGVQAARKRVKMHFDINDSDPYAYTVKMLANVEDSNCDMKVIEMTERFQRTFNSNDTMVYSGEYGFVDGPPMSYLVGTDGVFQEPIYQEGPFFELPPGPVLFTIDVGDIIGQANEDVDKRVPTPTTSMDREITVQLQHYPRMLA